MPGSPENTGFTGIQELSEIRKKHLPVSGREIHKNLGNRMKPGVPAHGASRFTTQLPLLQDRTGLDMPAQPGAKSAVQDSHTAVSFYSRRASRGSVVKPPWNTGPNAAREDMPRKGLNKAERHTRKRRKEEASFLLPHGECGVRGDAPQESLGLPSGPPFSKGEEDLPHDDGTCCYPNCCHCRHCRHRFGWWKLGRFLSPVCEGSRVRWFGRSQDNRNPPGSLRPEKPENPLNAIFEVR